MVGRAWFSIQPSDFHRFPQSKSVDAVRWPPGTVSTVPTDRARRSDVPRSSRDLTVATRTAHVRLAAALLTPGRTAR